MAAGADAIGLVFYAGSKRAVSIERALTITAVIPAFVTVVGLFVNPAEAEVHAVLSQVPLDLLQFHGDESPEFCNSFPRPFLKAVRMRTPDDLIEANRKFTQARGLLLDAWDSQQFGGTGKTFDWSMLEQSAAVEPQLSRSRIIVAGGLDPTNVAAAINAINPWAVDVSSGVEMAPGLKSAELIQSFIREVHRV